jgi:hypothetical protein
MIINSNTWSPPAPSQPASPFPSTRSRPNWKSENFAPKKLVQSFSDKLNFLVRVGDDHPGFVAQLNYWPETYTKDEH